MKWEKFDEGWSMPVKSWCENCEEGAVKQAANLARHPALYHHVALMPDAHLGYGMPIGGVVAAENAVIPAAVGVDIGCGMIATETDIPAERFADMSFRRAFQERLKERIPVGEGVSHKETQNWEGFEEYTANNGMRSDLWPSKLDRMNLGTLGGGNHFIELQKSTLLRDPGSATEGERHESKVWLMIHSGSRNLGKRIEEHYHRIANRLCTRFRVPLADPDLAFLPIEEADGHNYFTDMLFALRYAQENRRRMMEAMKGTVAEFVPEANFLRTIDIHHNYAACEEHFGKKVFVHRKGATSAKLDEIGVIPGSMGTASYIVRGLGNPDSFTSCSHGAGRRMSRVAASTTLTVEECDKAMDGIVCERWHKYKGFGKAKGRLDLSEAPQAYKDIEDVIASERDLVEPLVRLVPLASLKG
ncbi:MAG: RtcB family protein [Kiritimatiellae bacterium]|nr:RtcB family protein [Kiritimatiellia bacterium]